jgi:hypothetical protein
VGGDVAMGAGGRKPRFQGLGGLDRAGRAMDKRGSNERPLLGGAQPHGGMDPSPGTSPQRGGRTARQRKGTMRCLRF